MANREACELYIEQEIESGLEGGKTPYAIGKELSDWVAKLFEVRIKPATIEKRAERKRGRLPTNVGKKSHTAVTITNFSSHILKKRHPQGGGRREGAGRPQKRDVPEAMLIAAMAINQLKRIRIDDPRRDEAFEWVVTWIQVHKGRAKDA